MTGKENVHDLVSALLRPYDVRMKWGWKSNGDQKENENGVRKVTMTGDKINECKEEIVVASIVWILASRFLHSEVCGENFAAAIHKASPGA